MSIRLIVGCGYVGLRVAKRWQAQGDRVFCVTRSAERAEKLSRSGLCPIVWNWLAPLEVSDDRAWQAFCECTSEKPLASLLISVSHQSVPGIATTQTHTLGLSHLYEQVDGSKDCRWIYLSTTGVFGNGLTSGDWVDETTNAHPERPGSIAAWEGENWMRDHFGPERHVVLRPAGIYGPSRVPQWQSVRDGKPLAVQPDSYLNLIHVEDLADLVAAVSDRKTEHALYCVSDEEPVLRRDYYQFIADLGGWAAPVFEPTAPINPALPPSRGSGSKKVSSRLLLSELRWKLRYPNFRVGLPPLLTSIESEGDA